MQPNGCRIWWTGSMRAWSKRKIAPKWRTAIWIDNGFTGQFCDPFFWEWWNVSLLINKVTSNWEINWEVKRALWITWQTCFSKQLKITLAARRGKTSKNLLCKHGSWRELFFHVFYHISFPYFYNGCCCFWFFSIFGAPFGKLLTIWSPSDLERFRGIWNPL